MSEQSNISTVQGLYAALNKGDMKQVQADLLHDQVSLHIPGRHPLARKHEGKQNVIGFFTGVRGKLSDVSVVPETIAATGDQVLAAVRVQGRRNGKQAFDSRDVHVFTVAAGKITEIRSYSGDQQASDAVLS
jgi:hypothetical protein